MVMGHSEKLSISPTDIEVCETCDKAVEEDRNAKRHYKS